MRAYQTYLCGIALALFPAAAQERITVNPVKTGEILINPGKGIATFQHFNGDPLFPGRWSEQGPLTFSPEIKTLENTDYPPTSLAYVRWYWNVLEPEKGSYNWKLIDDSLLQANRHGQTLQIRLMPQSQIGTELPEWYMKEAHGFIVTENNQQIWQPDYNDPKFVQHWGALIRESGRRYDGHPWLESVDLGALGYWGEWHTYTRPTMMPGWEIRKQLLDIYLESFKKTPLLMLIGGEEALKYATDRGAGWRADSLGGGSQPDYGTRIASVGISDVWKKAPVVFEVGRTFGAHKQSGSPDIDVTMAEALRWHASSINAKSSPIPKEWAAKFLEFNDRLGYRFELRRMEYRGKVRTGSMMPLRMWWVNTGVAPVYRKYALAIELRNAKGAGLIRLENDLTKWLPGDDILVDTPICIPNLEPGTYRVRVGLLDPYTDKPAIKLAIMGRTEDNWHDLGAIEVLPWELQP
jgi:hypothetical protein